MTYITVWNTRNGMDIYMQFGFFCDFCHFLSKFIEFWTKMLTMRTPTFSTIRKQYRSISQMQNIRFNLNDDGLYYKDFSAGNYSLGVKFDNSYMSRFWVIQKIWPVFCVFIRRCFALSHKRFLIEVIKIKICSCRIIFRS